MLVNETNHDMMVGVRKGGPQGPLEQEIRVPRRYTLDIFKPRITYEEDGFVGTYNLFFTRFEMTALGLSLNGAFIPTLDVLTWRLSFVYSRDILEFRLVE